MQSRSRRNSSRQSGARDQPLAFNSIGVSICLKLCSIMKGANLLVKEHSMHEVDTNSLQYGAGLPTMPTPNMHVIF